MIKDYVTETGSVYRIDHDLLSWEKIAKTDDKPSTHGSFSVLMLRQGPYETRETGHGWHDTDYPVVGMPIYIVGKIGYSWISTDIVRINEVRNWDDPVERDS